MTARSLGSSFLTGLAAAIVVIGFLNFLWFWAEGSTIGDAGSGFIRDGRCYFVHAGRTTEVSRQTYEWSGFHGASLFVTHPLAILGGAYLLFTIEFPAIVGASRKPEDRRRVDRIRASGEVLASARTGGRLGELWLTRPLLGVEVRPGGVVLSPLGLPPMGIESEAIVSTVPERSVPGESGVAISHRQIGAPRVRLLLEPGDPVLAALRSIAAGQLSVRDGDALPQPLARSTEPYPRAMKAMIGVGFVLAIVFAAVTIPISIRQGSIGVVWSVGVIAILGFNVWSYFVRNRDRW